jgi:hypothetical protein
MSGSPRFFEDIPVRPAPKAAPAVRPCMAQGCTEPGAFRAPRSRERINDYVWFCLDHVREYNRGWDFFRGMTPAEVERYIRDNVTGHRPTFPVGVSISRGPSRLTMAFRDLFGLFDNGPLNGARKRAEAQGRKLPDSQVEALRVLDLDETARLQDATRRYKELVKRYHPDANGGDRGSEERLKRVIRAYRSLRASNFR